MSDNSRLPWAGWPDEIGCNLAAGHLVRNIQVPITHEGRVQVETLMTAAGAIAGWGAQQSLIAHADALSHYVEAGQLHLMHMKDGRQMMFGDAINEMLVGSDPVTAQRCVWNHLVGAAFSQGLTQVELPDLQEMFAHVARECGGPREGFPSTSPQHQPLGSAGEVLTRVLPLARDCLTGEISEISKARNFRAELTSYQIVTAWSAGQVLCQCCQVIEPKTALIIAMEAAIYASKQMLSPAITTTVEH